MFQLTVRGPDGSEKLYFLGADQGLLVGRDETSDIVLPSNRVSRRHARFFTTGPTLQVEDLGSQSGVFVGGARVQNTVEIRPGPPIEIGEFTIRIKREQAVDVGDYLGILQGAGPTQGRTLTLPIEKAVIGREAPAEIVIADDSVSRRHAEIRRLPDGSFVVRDLNSSNGTLINNVRIPAEADRPLRPNDKLAFGDTQWVVAAKNQGPSTEVQRSRTRLLVVVGVLGVVVIGAIGIAVTTMGNRVQEQADRQNTVSPRDMCEADVQNGAFDKALASCQVAYEQDPIDGELRKMLRRAQREAKYKTIYDQAVQRELADELAALDLFFQIDANSAYFAQAKIEVDKVLDRQRPQLLATCRDAGKKKGNEQAVEPCTRYLDYTCHSKGVDQAVLKVLKNVDAKKAAEWACPAALRPWFVDFQQGPKAEDECPKKYSSKEMADACVFYVENDLGQAKQRLEKMKDKAATASMQDDINFVEGAFKQVQSALRASNPAQARRVADDALSRDGRITPSNIESYFAREMRNMVASAFVQQGTEQAGHNSYDSAYASCAIAAKYRSNYQGVSQCLQNAGEKLAATLTPNSSCEDIKHILDISMPGSDLRTTAQQLVKSKPGCQ